MMTIKMTARLWISNNDDNDIEVTIRKKITMIATMIIRNIMENDYYSNKNNRVILLIKKYEESGHEYNSNANNNNNDNNDNVI